MLLAEKKAGGGKGRFQRAAPTVLKELGEHPSEGGKVQVLSGRYGPYVKHGDVNATLPRGKEPAALSLDEAVAADRRARSPRARARPRAAATARAAAKGGQDAAVTTPDKIAKGKVKKADKGDKTTKTPKTRRASPRK